MDLGLLGVLIHVLGDAANNIGVIIAAAVIWKADYSGRYYADPAVSIAIAFMIFFSSIPLVKKTGEILMESAPTGVNPYDVRHDIEQVKGVVSIHELHIWRLNQRKSIATAHIIVADQLLSNFMGLAQTINECFHAYDVHSVTLQPELTLDAFDDSDQVSSRSDAHSYHAVTGLRRRAAVNPTCRIGCETAVCQDRVCCS